MYVAFVYSFYATYKPNSYNLVAGKCVPLCDNLIIIFSLFLFSTVLLTCIKKKIKHRMELLKGIYNSYG